jgi:hypothetical protein
MIPGVITKVSKVLSLHQNPLRTVLEPNQLLPIVSQFLFSGIRRSERGVDYPPTNAEFMTG